MIYLKLCTTTLIFMFALASNAATVTVNPSDLDVSAGSIFSVDIMGTDFNSGDLDGGGINLSFDAAILEVTNVTVNTDDWEFFSTNGTVDNGAGTVDGITFNSFQSRTGDLLFASIEFEAIGLGASAINLSEYGVNPFATGGALYPDLSFENGSVTVSTIPVPAAIWLFGSGILGLLGVAGRKKV